MTSTANLGLPLIDGGQAQKHVTHNEALRILDAAIQIAVLDMTRTTPPSGPAAGERHVVAGSPTGAWAGQAGAIATWQDGAWAFLAPLAGWCVWSIADNVMFVYDGTAWHDLRNLAVDGIAHLGVNTTASAPNLLSLKSNAALFAAINAADGGTGDVRLQLSKETSARTASVVFSDAYSGRAEYGLTGDDDFHIKVSADGASWSEAIKIDRATGKVTFPQNGGAREVLTATRTYYVRTDGSNSNTGLANTSAGAFLTIQKAYDVIATIDLGGFAVTVQIGDGSYAPASGTAALAVGQPWTGGGSVTFKGNTATPTNVVVSTTSADCFQNNVNLPGNLIVQDMQLQTATGGSAITQNGNGAVRFSNIVFGACANNHVNCAGLGQITAFGNYAIAGGAQYHASAVIGKVFINSRTVTISGTPAFSGTFAFADRLGLLQAYGMTFSGSATGTRYQVSGNAMLFTNGGGASYFPGNAAGSASTGGLYV